MPRLTGLLLLLCALPALAAPPRLTLFIVVDALGSDLLLRHRAQLRGGLAQLITQGAFFPDVRYEFARTRTASGHATLATGANPWRHGVVDNFVVDRESGQPRRAFADPRYPVLEAPLGRDDVSPAALQAETLADRLRLTTRERGRVVALSTKARSAIPLGGRLGQAYWFSEAVGKFVSGTYYTKELPDWLVAFNARRPHEAYFGKQWTLLRPAADYTGEDDRAFEADVAGLGRTFPHPLTGGLASPGPQSALAFTFTPYANEVLVQLARAAIEGEKLGRDEAPDLLAVSFSALDMAYHLYGPHSWEVQDALLRLDRQLGELLAVAEKAVGSRGELLVVLSSDHGGAAVPEEWAALGLPAQRLNPRTLEAGLLEELRGRFGSELSVRVEELDVYLGGRALLDGKLDGAAVRRAAAAWLARQPAVALAVASDDLYSAPDVAGYLGFLRRGYYPVRSGDVLYVQRPYQVVGEETTGTSHGSPHGYDSQVPALFAGKGVRPGYYPQRVAATDVAATAAALMQMGQPASCEGQARAEAIGGLR